MLCTCLPASFNVNIVGNFVQYQNWETHGDQQSADSGLTLTRAGVCEDKL